MDKKNKIDKNIEIIDIEKEVQSLSSKDLMRLHSEVREYITFLKAERTKNED